MAQLLMKRPVDANPLGPASPVPVRAATDADAPELARLLGAAYPEMQWDEARVRTDLLDAADVPVTYVVEEGGRLVATTSVRHDARFPGSGYVHYVGVDPEARGRSLGTVVMARVMRHFADDGLADSVLQTDDFRLPAITSYLSQGFVPQYPEPEHEVRWSRIFEQLAAFRRSRKDS